MNVEIGTEAAEFPEKEYINGIFLAVRKIKPIYNTVLTNWFVQYLNFETRNEVRYTLSRPSTKNVLAWAAQYKKRLAIFPSQAGMSAGMRKSLIFLMYSA